MTTVLALLTLSLSTVLPLPAAEQPEIFTTLGHDQAVSRARNEDRLLLIDFTAVWCSPCRKMDQTTWVDEAVIRWVGEHALAIQVDVDEEHDVRDNYKIQAMPTIVVVLDGEEVDRAIGYRDGEDLLAWLQGVASGHTMLDGLRGVEDTDVDGRYKLAKTLLSSGEDAEATGHLLWLWQHALEYAPSYVGVRLSFMVSDIKILVTRHQPAWDAFAQVADDVRSTIDGGSRSYSVFKDWTVLSDILGRTDELILWVEDHVDEQGRLSGFNTQVSTVLAEMFIDSERLADAGRLYDDIGAVARQHAEQARLMQRMMGGGDETSGADDPSMTAFFSEKLLTLQRVALAADRRADAAVVEEALLSIQDDVATRLAIVDGALAGGAVEPRHARLVGTALADADNEHDTALAESLMDDVAAALAENGGN